MFHRKQHPADQAAHPAAHHFWQRGGRHPAAHPVDNTWNPHTGTFGPADAAYLDSVRGANYTGPNSEFRHGPTRWEHVQYAPGTQGYATTGRTKMTHREKNMYATPFGTPGFAAENLLADNPWTHDTIGYDYYDYFADQDVRGPFGVAPGSVVPPSQRVFLGGNTANPNNYAYTNSTGAPARGGFMGKLFHKNPNAPRKQKATKAKGLNYGYMPTGAQFAHTNAPYVADSYTDVHEDILPGGGYERVETAVSQVTTQDVVYGGRGTNAVKSTVGNTRNPSMTAALPMNIPAATSTSTTTVSSTIDGTSVPIADSWDKRSETVVSAENPTTGLPNIAKNAK